MPDIIMLVIDILVIFLGSFNKGGKKYISAIPLNEYILVIPDIKVV